MSSSTKSDAARNVRKGAATEQLREPLLALGEVRTCLIQNSYALPPAAVESLMRLTPGLPVSSVERPMPRVVSPDQWQGVDCRLAVTTDSKRPRGVGTVQSYAVVTGGRVIQGSTHASVLDSTFVRRQPWAHYLRRPGTIEMVGRSDIAPVALIDGYLADDSSARSLDLGSISERMITRVQKDIGLDHVISLRAQPTVLRWAALLSPGAVPKVGIRKERSGNAHTVRLEGSASDLKLLIRFCEDLALHDWLLTTISQVIVQADRAQTMGRDKMDILQMARDQLGHLWMPAEHLSPAMRSLWEGVEARTGYNRQWTRDVARVRDQISSPRPRRPGY